MSFINVGQLVSQIIPKLHTGNARTKFGTMYNQIGEATTEMLIRIDPPDTIQKARIDNAIYSHVYNYTCPSYLKGIDRLIDIRPVWSAARPRDGYRYPTEYAASGFDDTIGANLRQFDIQKRRNSVTVETINGVKTLRISKDLGSEGSGISTLDQLNQVDSTLSWSGDVVTASVVPDYLDYIDYLSSISFTLSGATGQGFITVQLPNTIDLSQMVNLGSLFFWLKFADATRFTNVTFKFGNSGGSAYWQNILTSPQGRSGMDTAAWDLMRADWTKSTQSAGTPDPTQISWFQFTFNYTVGTQLTFNKINSLTSSLGQAYEAVYYSNAIYQDASTGLLKQYPTADTDIIMVDQPVVNILIWETVRKLCQEQQGKNSAADYNTANYVLEGDGRVVRSMLVMNRVGLYRDYIQQNPSQAIAMQETTHQFDALNGY